MQQDFKLNTRQIIRLHQMHRAGHRNIDIANALGVHRNTVTYHTTGCFEYEAHVIRQLGLTAPLRTDGWLNMQEAARLIPGHPPRPTMLRIIRGFLSRDMSSMIVLKTKMKDGRRLTKASWIREWTQKIYPEGLFASEFWIEGEIPWDIAKRLEWRVIGTIRALRLKVVWMPHFASVAADYMAKIRDLHRADVLLKNIGTCVL